ncbi:MAG TPA: hypothetical protein VLK36_13900 [Gaiellaceae bacterium]|nr:hypothetical protein [Gaiellaceae bacterium]
MRLLAVSRILLTIIDDNEYAASFVSNSFPVELRSMISATERYLDALGPQ